MPPSRIIIILCAIVAVLFGITLALSVRSGRDQRPVPQVPWVEALGNAFLRSQQVQLREISSPCLTNSPVASFVVERGQKCQAEIKGSGKSVRTLKLTADKGSECTIDFVPTAGDKALPVHSTSGNVELTVMKSGGTLTIFCSNPGDAQNCVVRIE
jgi:hypothetical protein